MMTTINFKFGIPANVSMFIERLEYLEQFLNVSNVIVIHSKTAQLLDLGIAVVHSGSTYNIQGIGTLNHVQTLNNGTTYYLITSDQYEPITWFIGESVIGTLWVITPSGVTHNMPIKIDNTGIYFTPSSQLSNLPIGTTFRFMQTIILKKPTT